LLRRLDIDSKNFNALGGAVDLNAVEKWIDENVGAPD